MRHVIKKLIQAGRLLFQEGLVDARAGNLSVRLGDKLLITRRGVHLGCLQEQDFILVDLYKDGPLDHRASSELIVHREVYKASSWSAVVHAHPISVVKLSFNTELIRPMDSEGVGLVGEVKVLPEHPPGSKELAHAVAQELKNSKLVVVRGHGVFCADTDILYAYAHTSVLERSCKILL